MDDFFQTDFAALNFDYAPAELSRVSARESHKATRTGETWTVATKIRKQISKTVSLAWKNGAYKNRKIKSHKQTAETRAKISATRKLRGLGAPKGRKHTAETIAKIRASNKATYAAKRK